MTRYTVQWIHSPGYSTDRDHLFDEFAACMQRWMQPSYATRETLRRAVKRFAKQARQTADFDGKVTYKIQEI